MRSICSRLPMLVSGVMLLCNCSLHADDERGFKPLFDGRTLDGWTGDENFWSVTDGTIVGESTAENPCKQNTFLVWDAGEVDDFELRLQFRISGSDQANSGIQFRGTEEDGHIIGYQADIDRAGKWVGALYDEKTGRRVLAKRGQKTVINSDGKREESEFASADELFEHVKPDDWNDYHIAARGNHITLAINGYKTAEVIDRQNGEQDFIGKLALQLHSGPPMKIEFRNIRLKRFPFEDHKKVVFLAGTRSHGYAAHEHRAGCLLLAKRLNTAREEEGLPVVATVYSGRWPNDPTAFDNADTVVSYCDGGARHPFNEHLEEVDALMDKGVGLVCIHYAVETTKGEAGEHFLNWIGGYFEPHWSVNPHWTANFDDLPTHPITQGVDPFEINDEWYYHMRFRPEMEGVTPILTDLPPRESLNREDGAHSGNPYVREAVMQRKEPQHVAWACERDNGGRGFGFTGGHFHRNWQDDDFRKLVLNAIVWTAKAEVPVEGVSSATPSDEEMEANQDFPKPDTQAKAKPRQPKTSPVSKVSPVEESRELKDAVAGLDVHEDLQVTLFAGEPMLANPANIDVDHLGRVWVCEAINYRAFRNADVIGDHTQGDRILILEDTDGDGQADKKTVFYQGHDVDSAHGVCVLGTPDGKGTRAIVSALDRVFFLTDDDGDLKADRKELLFTGISGAQHDHGIHAFVFGPDGKLYFNMGNAGKQIRDKEGNPIIDKAGNEVNDTINPYQQGMVFRCNLDGSEFETLAWNFRNNWEVCVDSFGTIWQSDNDDDGNRGVRINYVMEYGNYGYKDEFTGAGWRDPRTGWEDEIPLRHWHLNDPGVVPNLLQTGGGSPTGICVYEGELLPELFRNQLIHCDAGPNVVRCYPVKPDGAGYVADSVEVLVGTRDKWFRPSDVCVAPDGSVIVADWYDPGVGGHRMGDTTRGRLFRLTPKKHAGKYTAPPQDFSTAEGAVAALQSPNQATRYIAWTALQELGEEARDALANLWESDNPRMRSRALWAIGKLNGNDTWKVQQGRHALRDDDANIRVAALRGCRQLKDQFDVVAIHDVLDFQDPSAAVRREMLIGLRDLDVAAGAVVWAELALQHDGLDRWYLEALGIGAGNRWDECLGQWLSLSKNDIHSSAGRDLVWRSRAEQTPELLAEIILAPNTPTDELPRMFRSFDFQKSSSTEQVLERLAVAEFADPERTFFVNSEALERLEGIQLADHPELSKALNQVLDKTRGSSQFVKLVDQYAVADRNDDLVSMIVESPQSQTAVDAIRLLLKQKQLSTMREVLFGNDARAGEALLAALATTRPHRSLKLLQEVLENEDRPISIRRAAVKVLGMIPQGADDLLARAEEEQIEEPLRQAVASALHGAESADVRSAAEELFPLPASKDSEPLPPLAELLSRKGDVAMGRIVFHSTGTCTKCHVVNGLGREIGPNLSEIGKKLTKTAMFESILYPSAGISHNYESWTIVNSDGQVFNGLLVSETPEEVQLKDVNAIVHIIKTDDIELRQRQDVSLMPADLQKVMSAKDLVDVIEYMTTLKVRTE